MTSTSNSFKGISDEYKKMNELEKEPLLMIEGIDVRKLGEVFSGYYLNNPEEVTKIINLYRNQGSQYKEKDVLKILDEWFIDNQPTNGSDYLDNELFILATKSKLEELKNRIKSK